MNDYVAAEIVIAIVPLTLGIGATLYAPLPLKILFGIPAILVSFLGFYLAYLCKD